MRYIDTNVIVRYLVERKQNQPAGLGKFFLKLEAGEVKVECLETVFFQAIFVLKSFYKVKKMEIIEDMRRILLLNGLHMKSKRIMERTIEMWGSHPGDIIDCYIAANMEHTGEKELFTYDEEIKRFGIRITEPC